MKFPEITQSFNIRETIEITTMSEPTPRAVSFAMLKGGFGKSICANTLGGVLGDRGHNVLVADLDPAGHLSTGLGYYTREDEDKTDLGDVLLNDADPQEIIKSPGYGFDFIPALNLERVNDDLAREDVFASDMKLKNELVDVLLGNDYDYILFDVPGSRNKLVNNAVVGAPNAILPLMPAPEALNGLRETSKKLVMDIRQAFDFEILATIPNNLSQRIDQRTKDRDLLESMNTDPTFAAYLEAGRRASWEGSQPELHDGVDVEEVLDEHIPSFARITAEQWEQIDNGDLHLKPGIRHSSEFGDAYEERQPLTAYNPENPQLEHFETLADIVENGGMQA